MTPPSGRVIHNAPPLAQAASSFLAFLFEYYFFPPFFGKSKSFRPLKNKGLLFHSVLGIVTRPTHS